MMNKEAAIRMDEQDPLKIYRDEFYVKKGQYYLDGNSLGLLSKRAEKAVLSLLDSWKEYGIDGWTKGDNPWYYLSEKLGEMCAPLIGAKAEEVILTGSTTANLHQLLATFYKPQGKRVKILADELNFPTDLYAISSHLAVHNYDASYMKLVKSEDGHLLQEEAIIEAMTEEVAMVILPGVLYRSGQVLDIEKLTKAAHERDILIGFDLCHSIGSVPHELHNSGVDFAFWCNYKHLNGGPGSVAGIFVHEKHFGTRPGLAGWFGSDKSKQFDLSIEMTPADTAGAYQIGTPHILSLAPIYGSLEMFREVGIEAIRKKSLQLTQFFMDCIDQELAPFGFTLGNPKDKTRGGHIYLVHEEAARICSALKEAGVTPDFRAPNGIRLAPVALYNSFTDVWETVQILKDIMENEIYKKFENKRGVVA
ncbi:kynureninase [Lysinibacillus odysseyi]|uniref:Kynureninase n=1 Tax=Lysinibacillus odysseyi 34hs-1 = NBRC 100172 TaxID=1220589 RepID=A0A0A3IU94_9BACI|nr:kynureninase [Lysinibacillus odysseyi]KGR87030.1 kynureninase [Lysinibacillus odysseyi 34hs-1 = NBRC 100172]